MTRLQDKIALITGAADVSCVGRQYPVDGGRAAG